LAMPAVRNARMGLAAHLEGVLNGIFLILAGLIWPRLRLGVGQGRLLFSALLFGTYANWATTLSAAVLGTSAMTPIASAGFSAPAWQERVVGVCFVSSGMAMLLGVGLMLWGLRGSGSEA